MNIKTKLILGIGMLAGMIILLVTLSVVNLQLLTATEPDSPAAMPALERALLWISVTGGICILTGLTLLYWLPRTISKPIKELKQGILEIANHNYEERLDMRNNQEFREVAESFNRMAERLAEYRASTLADILSAKKFIEAIVNSIDDPIIGLNMDREILFINEEALNVLNLKRGNVIRKSAEELSLKNDLLRRLIRELVTPGDQKEPLKIYADDKESYFKASYIPIINTDAGKDEPSKLGDVILLKNITEFKELDSAKTTFISTISHELKTPIAAIMMSLQLLEDKRVGELNDEQEQLSKSIKENSERLLSITGELLNMTQVEAGKLQLMPKITKPIELIEYAIKANQVQADKFNIQIEVEYPEEKIGKLFVDSEKIAWVLTNLLSNAIRYSKENGRVVIGARQEGDMIDLYVQDFGKGIDPRYHKSIFDRYFRVPGTKVQGSGLGLSISRDFVEAHGGTLTVESELGKGTVFTFTLMHKIADRKFYSQKTEAAETSEMGKNLSGKHVLLAEDNDLNAEIAQFILEDMGLIVDRVEDGVQCVSRIEQKPAGTYDLILMDIQMPNMDGYRATEMIRGLSDKDKATIPIIAMTANAFEEDRKKALAKGMNGHIAKPVDAEKVEKTICSVLGSQSEQ